MRSLFVKCGVLLFSLLLFVVGVCYSISFNYNELLTDKGYKIGDMYRLAEDYAEANKKDSALVFYSLVYNSRVVKGDTLSQMVICRALNKAASIYFHSCDYKSSLELLLRALSICDEIGYDEYKARTYNGIGNIHYAFAEWGMAKKYYKLAYNKDCNKNILATVLNNLGAVAYNESNMDSALLMFRESYDLKFRLRDSTIYDQLNNIGLIYQNERSYDKALDYYNRALVKAREVGVNEKISRILYSIGELYFEMGRDDSATVYFERSSLVAKRGGFLDILAMNLLYLSSIEERGGNMLLAFDYHKQYSAIKDSVFNGAKYGSINQLQFLYDMSKVNKRIVALNNEQIAKEQTIMMQRRFQIVMGVILLIVMLFLFLLYMKHRNLNSAYNVLAKQNMEIVQSDRINRSMRVEYDALLRERDDLLAVVADYKSREIGGEVVFDERVKYSSSSLKGDAKEELELMILDLMEGTEVFCDVDFSINRLAELVGSNPNYVSQIINDKFGKNFRAFINDYRIRKARKMLSDEEYHKYTIESIATMVGFKSRNRFDTIFKEITGITPSFYVRSLKKVD